METSSSFIGQPCPKALVCLRGQREIDYFGQPGKGRLADDSRVGNPNQKTWVGVTESGALASATTLCAWAWLRAILEQENSMSFSGKNALHTSRQDLDTTGNRTRRKCC